MLADQAIFTSMVRRGSSGYHLVARSPGITESEAGSIARWAPSHGGLIIDEPNRASVNFHPLPGGRFALCRTCEGRPEYSGRGARQVYTHAIVIDVDKLASSNFRPFAVYRDALALGYFHYQGDPDTILKPVRLSTVYPPSNDPAGTQSIREIGRRQFETLVVQVDAGQDVVIPYEGDRTAIVEAIVSRLPRETILKTSFATSLQPSLVRPYRIHVVPPASVLQGKSLSRQT